MTYQPVRPTEAAEAVAQAFGERSFRDIEVVDYKEDGGPGSQYVDFDHTFLRSHAQFALEETGCVVVHFRGSVPNGARCRVWFRPLELTLEGPTIREE